MGLIDWLKIERNQNMLKFVGSGLVATVGVGWAAYSTLYLSEPVKELPELAARVAPAASTAPQSSVVQSQTISAASGGAAAGNISGGTVTITVVK